MACVLLFGLKAIDTKHIQLVIFSIATRAQVILQLLGKFEEQANLHKVHCWKVKALSGHSVHLRYHLSFNWEEYERDDGRNPNHNSRYVKSTSI